MAYQINKNAHRPRKISDKAPMKVRIARFLERQGFYVILFVCLGIVGVTAYVTLSGGNKEPAPQQQAADTDWPNLPSGQSGDEGLNEVLLGTPTPSGDIIITPTPSPSSSPSPSPTFRPERPSSSPSASAVPAIAQVEDEPDGSQTPSPTPSASTAPKQEASAKLSFSSPVSGKLSVQFADKSLVYSKTLKQWTTHMGIDIAAPEGTNVKAVLGGKVESVEKDQWLGYQIVITHDNDCKSVYANLLDDGGMKKGQAVSAGDVIGKVGKSALSECEDEAHLHFEFYQKKKALDPEQLINNLNKGMPESE